MLRYRKVSLEIINEEDEENEENEENEEKGEEWKKEFVNEDELTDEEKWKKEKRLQEQLAALEKALYTNCPKCNSEYIEFHHPKWNCNNCSYEWESDL